MGTPRLSDARAEDGSECQCNCLDLQSEIDNRMNADERRSRSSNEGHSVVTACQGAFQTADYQEKHAHYQQGAESEAEALEDFQIGIVSLSPDTVHAYRSIAIHRKDIKKSTVALS